jgi:hypothetical protein
MRPITVQETVNAIVERSLPVSVPFDGGLALIPGEDGRFRLGENLSNQEARRVSVWAKGADGRRLGAGHVLTRDEAERVVRTLLGLGKIAA